MKKSVFSKNLFILVVCIICLILPSSIYASEEYNSDFEEGVWLGNNYVAHLHGNHTWAYASLGYYDYSDLDITLETTCGSAYLWLIYDIQYTYSSVDDARFCSHTWYFDNFLSLWHNAYFQVNSNYFMRSLGVLVYDFQ